MILPLCLSAIFYVYFYFFMVANFNERLAVGRGRQLANSQRTFKAIQGPGHTVGGAFLRNPGHWNFTQA